MLAALLFPSSCVEQLPPVPVEPAPPAWRDALDLNGDGQPDRIDDEYTGGAHCCYRISVSLSGCPAPIALPFELDGGYVGGLDLSLPRRFDLIEDDGRHSILVETHTDNGERSPPSEALQAQGITTNDVLARFDGCAVEYQSIPWTVRPVREELRGAHAPAVRPVEDAQTGLWGYVDATGAFTIAPRLAAAGPLVDGVALVRLEGDDETWVISADGARLFAVPGRALDDRFREGLLLTVGPHGIRFVDQGGALVFAAFDDARPFSEGLAAVLDPGTGLWGYISADGAWAVPPTYSAAFSFSEGAAEVWRGGPMRLDRRTLTAR